MKETKITPIQLIGAWNFGSSLGKYSPSGNYCNNSHFDSDLSYLFYQFKYNFNRNVIPPLAHILSDYISKTFHDTDIIVTVPHSDIKRPYLPMVELGKELKNFINIPVDTDYLIKNSNTQVKVLKTELEKILALQNVFDVRSREYTNKAILLIDDHYYSGATLNSISQFLHENITPKKIDVLTIVS